MILESLRGLVHRFTIGPKGSLRIGNTPPKPMLPSAAVVWFNAADHPQLASGRALSAERGVVIQAPDQDTLDLVIACLTGATPLPTVKVLVIRGTGERMVPFRGVAGQWYSTMSEHLIPNSPDKQTPQF